MIHSPSHIISLNNSLHAYSSKWVSYLNFEVTGIYVILYGKFTNIAPRMKISSFLFVIDTDVLIFFCRILQECPSSMLDASGENKALYMRLVRDQFSLSPKF